MHNENTDILDELKEFRERGYGLAAPGDLKSARAEMFRALEVLRALGGYGLAASQLAKDIDELDSLYYRRLR